MQLHRAHFINKVAFQHSDQNLCPSSLSPHAEPQSPTYWFLSDGLKS